MKKLVITLLIAPLCAMAAGKTVEVKVSREVERRVEEMVKAAEGTNRAQVAQVQAGNIATKAIEMIQDGSAVTQRALSEAATKTIEAGNKKVEVSKALKDLLGLRIAVNESTGLDAADSALRAQLMDKATVFISKLSKDALRTDANTNLASEAAVNLLTNLKSIIAKGNKEELQSYITLLEKANSFERTSGIESLLKAFVEVYGSEAEAIARMKKVKDCLG